MNGSGSTVCRCRSQISLCRRLQAGQQFFDSRKFHWLDDVEVEPRFLRAASILVLPPAGQSHKDHVPAPRLLANTPGDIVPVQFGNDGASFVWMQADGDLISTKGAQARGKEQGRATPSGHADAAVEVQRLPSHHAGIIAGQVHRQRRDLFRLDPAAL